MFDSHCHLTDERFADDVDAVIDRARDAGVLGIVTVASHVEDARRARELASGHDRIWSTAGIHPHVAEQAREDDLDRVRDMLALDGVVAIGETGLDYHYDNSPRPRQRRLFEGHLAAAAETGFPVIVHCRSADDDVAAMIRSFPGVSGVLHCFAGGTDLFDAGIEAGWYISFAGLITFRRFDGADLVAATPADRLLVETDSPYLSPVPHRGRRNEPAFVVETCRAAAALRSEDADVTARLVTDNALRFYRLEDAGEHPAG